MNHSIYNRRSIRKYLDKNVPKEKIEQILDAARVAPSAKNRQPWKYIVFGGEHKAEFLEKMENGIMREERQKAFLPNSKQGIPDAKNTLRIMKEAPILIVVLNENGTTPFAQINADDRITEICDTLSIGASIENMLLKADEIGLGTLWIANTCFAYEELTTYLGTTKQLVGAIALGYADESPAQRPRKKLEEIVEYRGVYE
ncbi:MAG: nitroreductase family protein [Lachnospiraceae bacterium]|nr:nitroreductase family protein [Lachnospiraceae bacterium]